MSPRTKRRIAVGAVVAVLVGVAIYARQILGIELDPRALRDRVLALGPIAPIVMIGMVALRALIGLPSQLVLIVAGLCFGTVLGTLYGGIGMLGSGLLAFTLARYTGRDAIMSRLPARLHGLLDRVAERPGASFVFLATAYPMGPISAFHALAGVTAMRLGIFALAVLAGGLIRAGVYAYFGDSLVAGGLRPILQATMLIACAVALPLLFPTSRAWLARTVLAREG